MKKYFFMAIAVLASLTACQPEPEQVLVNDGTIKFMSVETRATDETPVVDMSTFKSNDNGGKSFTVYGFINGAEAGTLWETGVQPVYGQSAQNVDQWTVSPEKYWADAKYYNFYAFYNQGADVKASYANAVVKFDGGTEAKTDFVAASKCEIRGNVFNAPVDLKFYHQLSRVAIKFVNKFNDTNNKIIVSNIKVKSVATGATFTYTAPTTKGANASATVAISDLKKTDVAFDFLNDDAIQGVADGAEYNSKTTVYKYFVPAKEAYLMDCTVEFVTLVNDTEVKQSKNYKDLKLQMTDALSANGYVAGQSYVFTANVYDAISPIIFSVNVEPWGADTAAGDITIGQEKK